VQFPATDGQTAYGQLFVPTHPTGCSVVFPHGGPQRAMLPGFHYFDTYSVLYEMNQYLTSRGCVVLSVDYRGGVMHGTAFRNAPGTGQTSASEYRDILGSVDFLRARPDVRPDKMAIYGLSWGGYLAALGLARNSDIFKVGFDVAGTHAGPIASIDTWRSPVMLLQGDDDRNVDFQQGMDLAAALQTKRPDVELVQRGTPDEIHEIYLTYDHLVDTYNDGAQFLLDHL
jgi:dipeptidyl-peptidase-4